MLARSPMIEVKGRSFGPIDDDLLNLSVDVDVVNDVVEVYYNRDLRHRFDFETGQALSLDDDTPVAAASAADGE